MHAVHGPQTRYLLDHLDEGVVACDRDLAVVLYANEVGRSALRDLGQRRDEVPPALRRLLAVVGSNVSRGIAVEGRDGGGFYVRAKPLVGADGVILQIAPSVARAEDIRRILREQYAMSGRDCEIACLVRAGHTNPAIARHLGLSINTVKYHLRNVFAALGVGSRGELVAALDRITFAGPPSRDPA